MAPQPAPALMSARWTMAVALALAACQVPGSRAGKARATRPHIFHVIVDDLGWGNTGYHRTAADGTLEIQTPHLDGLVAEGVKLMRHYVHAECKRPCKRYLSVYS